MTIDRKVYRHKDGEWDEIIWEQIQPGDLLQIYDPESPHPLHLNGNACLIAKSEAKIVVNKDGITTYMVEFDVEAQGHLWPGNITGSQSVGKSYQNN